MREIGGYLEWEMPCGHGTWHPAATLLLKSARACLGLLLQQEQPQRLWAPYYICDEALEPVEGTGTEIKFYSIDEAFEIQGGLPDLGENDQLLYVNYFALKADYVRGLENHFEGKLWIDDVQAYFHVPETRLSSHFNSARKFVGVPDGACLYLPDSRLSGLESLSLPVNTDYRLEHLTRRLEGKTLDGREVFRENDRLAGGEIAEVSAIGRAMLSRIDYQSTARLRRENYVHLHNALGSSNQIPESMLQLRDDAVPYCYPYLPSRPIPKEPLWERKVFVPLLWIECTQRGNTSEREMAANLLPLPIDQRYNRADMDRVIEILSK